MCVYMLKADRQLCDQIDSNIYAELKRTIASRYPKIDRYISSDWKRSVGPFENAFSP